MFKSAKRCKSSIVSCNKRNGYPPEFTPGFLSLLLALAVAGCGDVSQSTPEPSSVEEPPSARKETLEEREARLNATVWKKEMQAQRYGKALVKLNDEVRSAANKLSALAQFEFQTMEAPAPRGKPDRLELGDSTPTLRCLQSHEAAL
jgi:hypothetical protein